jgi:hypothetical protein
VNTGPFVLYCTACLRLLSNPAGLSYDANGPINNSCKAIGAVQRQIIERVEKLENLSISLVKDYCPHASRVEVAGNNTPGELKFTWPFLHQDFSH